MIDPLSSSNLASQVANTNNVKTTPGSQSSPKSFSSVLNQAIQANSGATNSASTNSASSSVNAAQATNMADLFSLLIQSQLNNMLTSTLGSTGSSSSSSSSSLLSSNILGGSGSSTTSALSLLSEIAAMQSAVPGSSGTTSSGNNSINSLLTSSLLPLLLGSSSNLGGSAGITMAGSQLPMGSLSTPVINATSAPSAVNSATTSTTSVSKSTIQAWINQYAPQFGLDPKLVNAVVTEESGYSPTAISSAGAMGLMQLMPETAATLGVSNPYDPLSNLLGGMTYLSELLKSYHGNVSLALAAYNAGSNAVAKYGGIPPYPETQRYVQNVLALMNQ